MGNFRIKNSFERIMLFMFSTIFNTLIILYITMFIGNEINSWMFRFSIAALFQLIINIFILNKLGENLFSLSMLFLIFSSIFHLGQVFVIGFSLESNMSINILNRISIDVLKEASIYTLITHGFLSLGMQGTFLFKNKNIIKRLEAEPLNNDLALMRKIGKMLILIGIIPTLYIDFYRIIIFLSQGYVATYSLSISGFVTTIARSFELGLLMLMIGNNRNLKKARNVLFFTLLYYSIVMLSGHRGRAILFIITMIYFYINTAQKVSAKTYFKFGVIGYILLIIINTIGDFRHYVRPTINDWILMISKNIGSPIIDAIGEFGSTMISLCLSIQYCIPIQYGMNYLQSLLLVFPNVGGILNDVIKNVRYTDYIPEYARKSLGGSYIGEAYFSFNSGGVIFAILIGIVVAMISLKFKKLIIEKAYLKMSYYLILFPDLLWWVRSYFSGLVRDFVWLGMLIYFLKMAHKFKVKKEIKRNMKFDCYPLEALIYPKGKEKG